MNTEDEKIAIAAALGHRSTRTQSNYGAKKKKNKGDLGLDEACEIIAIEHTNEIRSYKNNLSHVAEHQASSELPTVTQINSDSLEQPQTIPEGLSQFQEGNSVKASNNKIAKDFEKNQNQTAQNTNEREAGTGKGKKRSC